MVVTNPQQEKGDFALVLAALVLAGKGRLPTRDGRNNLLLSVADVFGEHTSHVFSALWLPVPACPSRRGHGHVGTSVFNVLNRPYSGRSPVGTWACSFFGNDADGGSGQVLHHVGFHGCSQPGIRLQLGPFTGRSGDWDVERGVRRPVSCSCLGHCVSWISPFLPQCPSIAVFSLSVI